MTGTRDRSAAIPAGIAARPATSPIPATEQTTIAMVCRGVIPTARNTPIWYARSLVCSSTVLRTPSPAAPASSSARLPIRPSTSGRPLLLLFTPATYPWPSAAWTCRA
jgi:hypothetical protein